MQPKASGVGEQLKNDGTPCSFVDSECDGGSSSEACSGRQLRKRLASEASSVNCAGKRGYACECGICGSVALVAQCVNCDNKVCKKG